jgi:hypothetical protein
VRGSGLHVFDASQQERVHVGRWLVGAAEHYGIRIFSASGTTLLDDEGILQTWQEGRTDNVDISYPMTLNVYLPPETRTVKRALLRIKRAAFRAYETGAASGGGTTVSISQNTTGASSATTTGPSSTATVGPSSASTTSGGTHKHTILDQNTGINEADTSTTHHHNVPMHNTSDGGDHLHGMDHTHDMPHTHNLAHTHDMSHSHSIGSHTHPIVYGIYTSPGGLPTGVTVVINGTDRTATLGGPFSSDQNGLDISTYLTAGAWNTIQIGAGGLGRIDATVFLQVLMGV